MRENYKLIVIDPMDLPNKVLEEKRKNNRLVQICSVSVEGGYELSYSFAEGYDFINYRINIAEDVEIPKCEHIFSPVDSTGETLACSKCGLIIKKNDKLNSMRID